MALTAAEAKKYVGHLPYVFKTSVAGEFSSDFIPLGQKVGYYFLDESSGTYYETAAGTGVNAGDVVLTYKTDSAPLVVADKPFDNIDEEAPYRAIANYLPTIVWTNGIRTSVTYTDNRAYNAAGEPLYPLGFSYKDYGKQLLAWALGVMGTWYDDKAALVAALRDGTIAPADIAEAKEAIEFGVSPDVPGFPETDNYKVLCWAQSGALLEAVLDATGLGAVLDGANTGLQVTPPDLANVPGTAGTPRAAHIEDYFVDPDVSLDAQGVPFVTRLSQESKAVTDVQPAPGPFDYLVTPDGDFGRVGNATAPKAVVDALAVAGATDADKLRAVGMLIPASVQEFLTYTGKVERLALDKTEWAAPLTVGSTDIRWNGSKWVLS